MEVKMTPFPQDVQKQRIDIEDLHSEIPTNRELDPEFE
jgi:hypothetical protein